MDGNVEKEEMTFEGVESLVEVKAGFTDVPQPGLPDEEDKPVNKKKSRGKSTKDVSPVTHYQFSGQTLVTDKVEYFLISTEKLQGLKIGVQQSVSVSDLNKKTRSELDSLLSNLPSLKRLLS